MSVTSQQEESFDSQTYEGRRKKYKNNVFTGSLIFFKSTVGIGLLVNQYFVGKCGIIWGLLITFGVCFLVSNVLDSMMLLTNQIEQNSHKKIFGFDQFTGFIFGKQIQILSKIFIILYNEVVLLVNTINLSKFVQFQMISIFGINFYTDIEFIKWALVLIFLFFLTFIVEPEKIKYVTFFSMFILVLALILMWGNSLDFYFKQKTQRKFDLFNFAYTSDTIGQLLYTFESIGTIFTIRQTLRRPKKMRNVLYLTYFIVTILIIINSIIFLITYGNDGLQIIAFDYFNYDISLRILESLFYITLPAGIFICLISNSMEIEHTSVIQKLLRNDFGIIMISRLMIFRLTLSYIMLFPIFFLNNEIILMVICGGFIVPIIGFIIPIMADIKYNKNNYNYYQFFWRILMLLIALTLSAFFVMNLFNQL